MEIEAPEAFDFLYDPPLGEVRYRVSFGGRGSAKSWQYARALLALGSYDPLRVLCAREIQASIKDSVHALLRDQIQLLGLDEYEVLRDEIRHPIGTRFIFKGLRDPDALKSAEGIDVCWVEEAHRASNTSWERLIPTIRKPGSEIWVSFNPDQEDDPTYQRFIVNTPPRAIVREVNWRDNPWFSEEMREEKDYLYRVDPDAAEHVWGGATRQHTDAQIMKGKWTVESFEPSNDWDGPYNGSDFGFSQDPTTLVECWLHGNDLHVRREAYKLELDIHLTAEFFQRHVPGCEGRTIRADSASPGTISYLRQHGLPKMIGVDKWAGSIEDGIRYIRSFERVVIHPDCPHTAQEFRLYSYKVDPKTNDVLDDVLDKHNHCIDGIRYALAPMIKAPKRKVRIGK